MSEQHEMPCQGCGAPVVFISTRDVASEWASDVVRFYCAGCWDNEFGGGKTDAHE